MQYLIEQGSTDPPGSSVSKKNNTSKMNMRLQSMVHHRKYPLFTLDLEATQYIARYPLHHDTYAHVKFTVATSNRLGRYLFTRKYSL